MVTRIRSKDSQSPESIRDVRRAFEPLPGLPPFGLKRGQTCGGFGDTSAFRLALTTATPRI
jgi:hypothetical protein